MFIVKVKFVLIIIKLAIVVVLASLFVVRVILSKRKREKAPGRLQMAKEAFAGRNDIKALAFLNDAFFVPPSGKYKPEEAAFTVQVLEVFDNILEAQGLKRDFLTEELKNTLIRISKTGGEVSSYLTEPVARFLERASSGSIETVKLMGKEMEAGIFFSQLND